MTTTINADNGVSSGSAGLKSSADSSGVLALQTNGTTAITVGTDQSILMTGAPSIGGAGYGMGMGFRNRIINGAMVIDQRNAGAEVNPAVSGSYYLDRWIVGSTVASKFKIGQNAGSVTPPAGFINYLGCTSLSAYTPTGTQAFNIQQRIEGFNVSDLDFGKSTAKSITLSFWVYASLTGTFGGAIGNDANNRSYPFSYTISSANTWEQKSITIAGDTTGTWLTTNGVGMFLFFNLGAGSTMSGTAGAWAAADYRSSTGATSVVGTNGATFYITGVQLEKGSTATAFDYRPYGTELALCQRYCQKFGGTGAYDQIGVGFTSLTTQGNIQVPLKVTMRAVPSVTSSTLLVTDVQATSSSVSSLQIVSGQTNENIGYVTATTTGMTQYRPCFLLTNNSTSGYVIFASEL